MKITKMITRNAVPSGPRSGNSVSRSSVSGDSGGSITLTGTGATGTPTGVAAGRPFPPRRAGAAVAGFGGAIPSSSWRCSTVRCACLSREERPPRIAAALARMFCS